MLNACRNPRATQDVRSMGISEVLNTQTPRIWKAGEAAVDIYGRKCFFRQLRAVIVRGSEVGCWGVTARTTKTTEVGFRSLARSPFHWRTDEENASRYRVARLGCGGWFDRRDPGS